MRLQSSSAGDRRGIGIATNSVIKVTEQEGLTLMLENSNKSNRTINEILESLSVKEETYDTFYQTRSREDYDLLLNAALAGDVEGAISVGHSAIYLNKVRVNPPSEISN